MRARGRSRSCQAGGIRAEYGRLFCERHGLDPVSRFGSDVGEACIEVHHEATATLLAEMASDHRRWLEELRCLCANCHRETHRELRAIDAAN
ncbi:hypothetical protein DAH55_20165 [Sphingomonas koreensis]|nr:hypothetical protein DAH56_20180 [Sphingomonas koreensis]RSU64161.1 hypothetical protein DAH55_20165 [Sphingomonas koreensis]